MTQKHQRGGLLKQGERWVDLRHQRMHWSDSESQLEISLEKHHLQPIFQSTDETNEFD